MGAVRQDVEVVQNATFRFVVNLHDEDDQPRTDLAGYTGAMQIRAEQDNTSTLIVAATVTIDTGDAQATATIANTVTAGLDFVAGWYDLHITHASAGTEPIAWGRARFRRTVTI